MSDDHEYVRRPFKLPTGKTAEDFTQGGRRYLVLPPELSDGASKWVVSLDEIGLDVIDELLRMWQDEATPGETLEIGFVEMTEAEFKALPEM